MNKKLFKLMLVTMAFAILLSACVAPTAAPAEPTAAAQQPTQVVQQPTAAVPPTKAPIPEPTAVPEPTDMPVEDIELWASGRVSEAGPPPDDWVAYQIMKDTAKVNLKLVLLPSTSTDQDTKINAAAASNSLPDVFFVNRDVWYKLVQNGLVAKVDDLLPMMPVRTAGHYNDADRNKLVTYEGSMYGLPDPGAMPQTDSLVIRQDWLTKLSLQAPKTIDDFMAVAKAFTFDDPDGNGQDDTFGFCAFIDGSGLNAAGLGPRFDFIFGAYGVAGMWDLSSVDSFGMNVRNENFFKATEFIKALNDEKVIDPDWPVLKKDEFRARWKQGKCGMMHENFAALANKSNYKDFDENFPDGEWVAFTPPTGPDGKSSAGLVTKSARIYAISQKAIDEGKGPAIARLLEWMASDEGYYLLGFGVRDVNYKLDANGYITTEGIAPEVAWTTKEMQPLTQLANMVYIFTDVELKARYVAYQTKNGRTMDPLAYYNTFLTMPFTEATGASIINPPANGADFIRFYSENIVQFVLGQKELNAENWAAFIEGLDSLGAKDLEATAKASLIEAGFLK